ncbi:hypothetical protein B9T62_35205 [Paenibacillus donghaensis]|uniref:Uncharacterized protein n=2 Tax=Paenibacillus donghaensis TaxID=414771 RepID=A0A2Z2KU31_9BACL|nr:hypothetical protein B9T62_35205 [Paenibacillus donghaensis]
MSTRKLVAEEAHAAVKQTAFTFPTARRLFWRRLRSHMHEQQKIIRTAADWTVLLYFIIPGGLLGGRFYLGFWNEPLPDWIGNIPFSLAAVLLVLVLSRGGMLLLLQEGDLLFLKQRTEWIRTIMLRGIVYSLILTTLKIAAVFVLLLPFLIRSFGWSADAAAALLVLSITASWFIKPMSHIVKVQRQGWRRWLWQLPGVVLPCGIYVRVVLYGSSQPLVLWITACLFAAGAILAIRLRLGLQGTFLNDVREDYKQRMRIAALMLRGVLDKPRPTRHKPWIFRKSQPLLKSTEPESRFAAAAVKALLRNPAHLKLYLQFMGVSLVAIFIVPAVLKWIIFIVLSLLFAYWLTSFWIFFAGDDYIGILPFTKEQKAEAGARTIPLLLIPYTVLCAAVVCIPVYSWWGLLLFIPVGAAAGLLISRVYTAIRLGR